MATALSDIRVAAFTHFAAGPPERGSSAFRVTCSGLEASDRSKSMPVPGGMPHDGFHRPLTGGGV